MSQKKNHFMGIDFNATTAKNEKLFNYWMEALRSKSFKQGRQRLAIINEKSDKCSFCCLGVLEYICGTQFNKDELDDDDNRIRILMTPDSATWPTNEILRRLGVRPGISEHFKQTCARLNDTELMSFKQIAKYLEKHKYNFFTWTDK